MWERGSRGAGTASITPPTSKDLAFHLGGHISHSIGWKNLSPNGGGQPAGDLAVAIDDQFMSFDKFCAQSWVSTTLAAGWLTFHTRGRMV